MKLLDSIWRWLTSPRQALTAPRQAEMTLLDSVTLVRPDAQARVELYQGDLSAIPPAQATDVVVISASRGDYIESWSSLVGALGRKGLHLGRAAESKAVDLLKTNSCWLSQDVWSHGLNIRRLLCFEPSKVVNIAETV